MVQIWLGFIYNYKTTKDTGFKRLYSFSLMKNTEETKHNLSICTLNYSGVLTSPYQFYQTQSEDEKRLGEIFADYVTKVYPQFKPNDGKQFTWNMASIDTKWNDRYAPINFPQVGVNPDTHQMMNQQQFKKQWEIIHIKTRAQLKKYYFQQKYKGQEIDKKMHQQIQKTRQFDLFCYKTFAKAYCNIEDVAKIEKVDSKNYLEQRKKDFSKPYLNEQLKVKLTLEFLQKTEKDVLFLQQSNTKLVQSLKNHQHHYQLIYIQHVGSIILISKKLCDKKDLKKQNMRFLQDYSKQLQNLKIQVIGVQKLEERLNFNKDSVFQMVGNILLLCVHLTSKKQKNSEQVRQVAQQYNKIVQCFPEITVIIGGDFNSNVDLADFSKKAKIFSISKQQVQCSVNKKRTYIQPQRNKALKLDKGLKDFIFSNRHVLNGCISMINGKRITSTQHMPLLPNKAHPYDHYLAQAEIELQLF